MERNVSPDLTQLYRRKGQKGRGVVVRHPPVLDIRSLGGARNVLECSVSTACQPAQIVDFQLGLQPVVVKATQMVGACYSRPGNQSGHFLFPASLAEHSLPLLSSHPI